MEWWNTGQIGQKVQVSKIVQGTNNARHRDEMRLTFYLGTLWPHELNVDFSFLISLTRSPLYLCVRILRATV